MKVKLSPDSELPTTVGILAKTRGKMTTAITFSRQNDAGSCVSNTQHALRKSRTRSCPRLRI